MIIPKQLKICGYTYEVIFQNRSKISGTEAPATCNIWEQKIWIDTTQCQEAQESALLHEILEAINYRCHLELPHKSIGILETALYQVLKDNKLLK